MPHPEIHLQQLNQHHAAAAVKLLWHCHPHLSRHQAEVAIAQALAGDSHHWLIGAVTGADEMLGLCWVLRSFYSRINHFGFGGLSVHESARRQGIGSQLVMKSVEFLATLPVIQDQDGTLELLQDGTSSVRFYEKLGFQIVYHDPAGRPVMVRTLSGRPLKRTGASDGT